MSNPAALVRCLVVSAFAADTPPHCLDDVAFLSADPLNNEGRTVFRCRRKDVPEHATWLISTNSDASPPDSRWGLGHEAVGASPNPVHTIERSECDHDIREEFINRLLFNRGAAKIFFFVFLGPLMAIVVPGLMGLEEPVGPASERFMDIIFVIAGLWFGISTLCILWYLCYLTWDSLRAYRWRKTALRSLKPWRGGTTACQFRGYILRRGPRFQTEDWKRYWVLLGRSESPKAGP